MIDKETKIAREELVTQIQETLNSEEKSEDSKIIELDYLGKVELKELRRLQKDLIKSIDDYNLEVDCKLE